MYLCIYVPMYLCTYVSMYLCIYVSMYLCIYLIHPSIHPSVRPSVHLSDPSIHPSIDLSIYPSIPVISPDHQRVTPMARTLSAGSASNLHLGAATGYGTSGRKKTVFFVGTWMGWILGIYRRFLGIHIGDILWGFIGFFDGIFIGDIIDILWGFIGVFDGNFFRNPELWSYFFSTESSTVSHTFSDNSCALKRFWWIILAPEVGNFSYDTSFL